MSRHRFRSDAMNFFSPLPSGWRDERVCDVVELRTSNVDKKSEDGGKSVRLCNYVDVYKNDKITLDFDFMEATATESQIERFTLRINDVVITKDSESPDDIGVPALIAETASDLVCGYHLTILRPNDKEVIGNYLFHAVASRLSAYQFYLAANGVTRFGLTYQGTKNLRIAFPPLNEQRQIAAFLDWKTGQIDALIERKKELLEKLKEKRLSVITQAVTRGLNPTSPLRESGVEWLGQVPKHWGIMQLRRRWTIHDCKHKTVTFVDNGVPLVSIQEVSSFEVNLQNANKTTEEEYLDMIEGGRRPEIGDIIYSRNATVGDASIVTTSKPFCMGQDVCLLRSTDVFPRFIAYLLRSHPMREQARALMIGSTFNRINVGQIKSLWVAVPPLAEQTAIAVFLDRQTKKIDLMINKVECAITRLAEYRTALITAATTGKIDVRKVKIPTAT